MPKVHSALELYHILSESNTDLRQPVALEKQLLKDEALDSEVGQSMLQLLQVSIATIIAVRSHAPRKGRKKGHKEKKTCEKDRILPFNQSTNWTTVYSFVFPVLGS